ncbi:hypothetical protein F4678DRAFT_452917 [Xylaria arbuscula]|nr:hypothetical protein F4678DRAFT_452917 [Xylaria arbuscula]
MSGFEVAGIVLGAFPIAMWGLEKYRDVARRAGFWYEIRSEYQRTSNELKFHRLSFERNLEQLLFPLVPDENQLQGLIAQPGGPEWKNPVIEQALEKRLQKSYHLYLEILDEMQQTMQELNKELSLEKKQLQYNLSKNKDQTASPSSTISSNLHGSLSRSNRDYQMFRIKFSMGESTRARLFSELQTYNDRLEKLTSTSDTLSELQAGRQSRASTSATSAMHTALCRFWNQADQLYKALVGAWGCSCYEFHSAELLLKHRQPSDKDFFLNLHPGPREVNGAATTTWSRCSVRLQVQEREKTSVKPLKVTTSSATVSLSTPQHRSQQPSKTAFAMGKPTRKTQSFAHGAVQSVSRVSATTLTILAKPLPLPPPPTDNIVKDLCKTLGTTIKPRSFIELNEDTQYNLTSEGSVAYVSSISLSEILSGSVNPLTRRQRYRLSMTIASSFVQLKGTPWLHTPWGKEGVYFPQAVDQRVLLLDSPFIVQSFTRKTVEEPGQHDVAGIASLGVVLLELCFGTNIDRHPSRLKFPSGDVQASAAFDLIAALEWLKEVNDEAGPDYSEAVEWCLAGCRTLPSNEAWRKLMVEKVVAPLERCYNYLNT